MKQCWTATIRHVVGVDGSDKVVNVSCHLTDLPCPPSAPRASPPGQTGFCSLVRSNRKRMDWKDTGPSDTLKESSPPRSRGCSIWNECVLFLDYEAGTLQGPRLGSCFAREELSRRPRQHPRTGRQLRSSVHFRTDRISGPYQGSRNKKQCPADTCGAARLSLPSLERRRHQGSARLPLRLASAGSGGGSELLWPPCQ